MSVGEVARFKTFEGSGSAGAFSCSFPVLSSSHITVTHIDSDGVRTLLVLDDDYTVSLVSGGASGFSVTTTDAVATGESLLIEGDTPHTQEIDFHNKKSFDASAHEYALDKLTMQVAEVAQNVDSLLRLPLDVEDVSLEVPAPEAGKVLGWNTDEDALVNVTLTSTVAGLAFKESVRVATTTNGTLSTAFDNGSTVDGVVLATNDRILIKDQTDATKNGIYIVQASGAPIRATDADEDDELFSCAVYVEEGTANGGTMWVCTNSSVTVGTTDITFQNMTIASGGALLAASNLSDLGSASTARTNLGLGTIATQAANSVSITGGSITGITDLTVADGGSGRSSATAYAVIVGGTTSTGAHQSVASVGTAGQVLTSNGAGAKPSFQDSNAGAMIEIAAYNASGTATIPITGLSSAYKEHLIKFSNVYASTGSRKLCCRTSADGGATIDSTAGDYASNSWSIYSNTGTLGGAGVVPDDTLIQLQSSADLGTTAATAMSGEIRIMNHANASGHTHITGHVIYSNGSGHSIYCGFSGHRKATAIVDAIQICLSNTGNIDGGTFTHYGIT